MQAKTTFKPMLTVDEVEQIDRKKVATIIGHVFQLTYAAYCDKLVQEEKANRCQGCAIQHPSQRQHPCPRANRSSYVEADSGKRFSTLGLKLGQTCESYLTELPKLPWASL